MFNKNDNHLLAEYHVIWIRLYYVWEDENQPMLDLRYDDIKVLTFVFQSLLI